MEIDVEGGMIVGEIGNRLETPEGYANLSEWAEDNAILEMSTSYNCDRDWRYYGFEIKNIRVSEIDGAWLEKIRARAEEFEKMTGVPAKLIGTQNVW